MLLRIIKRLVSILEHWLLSIRAKNNLAILPMPKKPMKQKQVV
jgi:hypothetical protein